MPKKLAAIIFLLGLFIFVPGTYARAQFGSGQGSPAPRVSPKPTPVRALNEVRLQACQSRQEAIQNRMRSLVRLSQGMAEKFDSIAGRVKIYYQETVLPGGGSVPNYQALVDEIAAKKAIVDSSVDDTQGKMNAFGCDSDDPKGVYNEFRIGMQKVKSDLKNYRTAIRNLIVAVKRVAPTPTPEAED